jgi:PAS domain S-box-containing protein
MKKSLLFDDIFRHDQNFQAIMKNMLQTAFEISFDGVMITTADPGYPIIYVNPALCSMTGYSAEELLGESPVMLQGEKSNRDMLSRLKKQISEGQIFHGKTVNYRKDQTEFIMEWRIVPIYNENADISHYLAIQREIEDDQLAHDAGGSHLPSE